MKMRFLVKQGERLIHDNAPTILAGVAIVGTAATAYLTGKATFKAAEVIGKHPDTTWDKTKKVWHLYLPPAAAGITTIACIVCSTRMNAKRAAAMAAVYSLSEKKLAEYKDKVEEKLGIEKKKEIEESLIQDRMTKAPSSEMVVLGGDDVLCFDSYSGRFFKSSMESVRQAANNTNFEVINQNYATLEFFWNEIGLDPTAYSDEFGWDATCPLHIRFSTMMSGEDKPALVVDYDVAPVRRWNPVGEAYSRS